VAQRLASGGLGRVTVLCAAADVSGVEAARLLLEGGADPSLADGNGFTSHGGGIIQTPLSIFCMDHH
jgi:hypothetical protein